MAEKDRAPKIKSAYELALERMEREGVERPEALSDEARSRMAEIRRQAEAKLAELEILYRDRQVRYYGYYSNVSRAHRGADAEQAAGTDSSPLEPTAVERKRLRRSWAQLIRRIYEIDPLVCRECGADMRILAFILDPPVIRKILHHLGKKRSLPASAPPNTRATAIS